MLRAEVPRSGILAAILAAAFALAGAAAERVGFNRDVRPIMSDTCFRCHGPDARTRMAGLRLDVRDEALRPTKSGAVPLVPGSPERSAIIARVFSDDPARIMPPEFAHKTLTGEQKETLRRWVAEGAEYEGHWAYLPVRRPDAPALRGAAIRNPIDAFVQARLRSEGLEPAPEAERRTLLRRVTLDLTGLPPSSSELAAFLADRAPDAYDKAVERLLASPGFAEKQAMHWLDGVRYADTCGFHGDNPLPAWPYRDYVLRAFRDNKPFDQFTRVLMAGDMLPNAPVEARVASAYNRLNRTSAEGGLQPKEYLAKYAADRVRTLGAVWLGSTVGCAECHNHRFDPFTAKDFYSLKAFFADVRETGLVPDRGDKAWGSKLRLPSAEQQARIDASGRLLAAARGRLDERAAALAARQREWEKGTLEAFEAGRLSWGVQRPVAAAAAAAVLRVYDTELVDSNYDYQGSVVSERRPGGGLVVASGPNPDNDVYTLTLRPGAGVWTAFGIEVVADDSLPGARLARGGDRFVLSEVEIDERRGGARVAVGLALATSSLASPHPELPAMAAIDGDPRTGWGVATYGERDNPFLAVRFASRLATDPETTLTVRLRFESVYRRAAIGRLRLALSEGEHSWPGRGAIGAREPKSARSGLPEPVLRALKVPVEKRSDDERSAVAKHFRWASPELQPELAETAKLEAELQQAEAAVPQVVVTEAEEPRETRVLPRGNWMDDSGELVEPAVPAFLGKVGAAGRRATRLDLANWLVRPDNPLTARVFVNRVWRQLFGAGLSRALDDLGSQGQWPSHPELLDWLASEFMRPQWKPAGAHAWDVKHLIRTIVTSHTYRQSSRASAAVEASDPDNRLLARQGRFRLDAELVRDAALAISGLLDERFGGPSVRPYQPDGYLAALNFPKRDYSASRGRDLYRRGVYTHWQRSFLHPSLLAFDAPTREECTVNRTSSNTPLQALVLLNDPIFVEAARAFAARILAEGGPDLQRRIEWAFERAVGRPPVPRELEVLIGLHRRGLAEFRAHADEAQKLASVGEAPAVSELHSVETAAMTLVARAILNLHETITRN